MIEKPEACIVLAMSEDEATTLAAYLGSRRSDGPATSGVFAELADALGYAGISFEEKLAAVRIAQDEVIGDEAEKRISERPVRDPFAFEVGKEVVILAHGHQLAKRNAGRKGVIVHVNSAYIDVVPTDGDAWKSGDTRWPNNPFPFTRHEVAVIG